MLVRYIKVGLHITLTHLESASLLAEAVKNARARAKKVVHASVCVVQAGIKLKCVIYGDGSISILHARRKIR